MCGKTIALVGESSVHGFGRTLDFKVQLVRRLVDECHYDAVFFESGVYDFLEIQRRVKSGEQISDDTIAAAIGGLWATKEVQPLIPYLRDKVSRGTLYLGGIDDQLGRGTWAQTEMPAALASHLSGDEKDRCVAILRRHTEWQYAADAPYGPEDKARLLGCLHAIDARLRGSKPPQDNAPAMIASLERLFDRDFAQVPSGLDETTFGMNARDRSMYANFHWLLSQAGAHRKVIVWTATVHAAKDLATVPGSEHRISFGSFVHRDFAGDAFALGFSAESGTYAMVGQPAQPLSPAPENSLERRSLAASNDDPVYLSQDALKAAGRIPARALGANFASAEWNVVLDGLVIFRTDHPPEVRRP